MGEQPSRPELPIEHKRAVAQAVRELAEIAARHEPFNSPHEGWAVIREELDELWEHVRANTGRGGHARREALQIAVTALRYAPA